MSFVEAFYSFNILFYSCSENKEYKFRFKVPKYPLETEGSFSLRILAYSLNYNEDLKFSERPYDNKFPTIFSKDYSDNYNYIIQIGLPEYKNHKLKANKIYTSEKTTLANAYFFEPTFLESFYTNLKSSNILEISEIDSHHYLKINDFELTF